MNNGQIEPILKGDVLARSIFAGVYPSDMLLDNLPSFTKPVCFIINTEPHYVKNKGHWIAVYFHGLRAEVMDNFGFRPSGAILEFILRNCKYYIWNRRKFQSLLSTVSGAYCIVYALRKSRGWSMKHICESFSESNRILNDKRVLRLFHIYTGKIM